MSPIPVLIVGGGPVGLSAAIALARQGVASILVERRPSTTEHPKARAINVRTMELLRQWGINGDLSRYTLPREYWRFIWCDNMTGRELARISNPDGEQSTMSPTLREIVSQDAVEKVLLSHACALPAASIRFSTECLSFDQTDTGVVAEVRDLETGRRESIAARYLIAADGATSEIRRALDIELEGPPAISHQASVYFRADLVPYSAYRPADIYYCTDGIWIAVVNGTDRWLGIMRYEPEDGVGREDFTDEFCIEQIRRSVGVADLPVEVMTTSFWKMGAQVARRFRAGRIFLAGDAAHRMSPTGGFGLNTGVQDSHNLAWKLAAVLAGRAGDALLDSYEDERKPVAVSNASWSADNARRIWKMISLVRQGDLDGVTAWAEDQENHICSEGRALGFRYVSSAVVPDGSEPPPFSSRSYVPSAFPGCRAPHLWLSQDGVRRSTLELFDHRFVLLHGADGERWQAGAAALEPVLRSYLDVFAIGPGGDLEDVDGSWEETYGLEPDGAVLVRPDGHVGWRSSVGVSNPEETLGEVLGRLLGRLAGVA